MDRKRSADIVRPIFLESFKRLTYPGKAYPKTGCVYLLCKGDKKIESILAIGKSMDISKMLQNPSHCNRLQDFSPDSIWIHRDNKKGVIKGLYPLVCHLWPDASEIGDLDE